MKRYHTTALSTFVLALALAAPAIAADEPVPPAGAQGTQQLPTMRVDQLEDMTVINEKGENVGDVNEIVRSKDDQRVYAIIGVGGFLGIAEHDIPISLQDLTLRGERLMLPPGTTKDQLRNLPEYDEDRFVELADDQVVTVGSRTTQRSGGGSR